MSESEHSPRRAFAQGTDSETPIADDDTPVSAASAARREADSEADDGSGDKGAASQAQQGPSRTVNPFARPGSAASADEPPPASPLVPAPVAAKPGISEGSTPEPRRSAVSPATPPEAEPGETGVESAPQDSWVQHHKRTLLIWGIGVLVVALLVVLGAFLAGRQGKDEPEPVPAPSPSTSISAVPPVSVDDLITMDDASAILAGASWAIVNTAETREEATERAACIGDDVADVNPVDTFQRTIGTSQEDALAALHQVDLYATTTAAQQVQQQRAQSLSQCDEVPARIVSSSTITGLGDEVTQLTVAYQEEQEAVHTVLLVRTGRALTMLDVTRNDDAVDVEGAAAGLERSLSDICSRLDGMCPTDPAVTPAVPPAADPEGWLITADLPRVRPGYGQWTTTEPGDITSKGMGCENLPLATEPGPTKRQQRTYLLTQDEETPSTFGIDEMVFDFEDNVSARLFTTKLIDSLLSCKDRNRTAKVTDMGAVNGAGADDVAVSARMFTIDQAVSDDSSVKYQLVVAIADTRVSYLLTSVTEDYRFLKNQQHELALRVAQRNSQG